MAFPLIILALAVVSIFGTGAHNVIIAITIPFIPRCARVVRSSALAVRETPYIDAARACGFGHTRIVLRHMVPNVMAPYLIMMTAAVGQAILIEASLSFLGLGVQEPTPAWGLMLRGGAQEYAESAPWVAIYPGHRHLARRVRLQPVRRRAARLARPEDEGLTGFLAIVLAFRWGRRWRCTALRYCAACVAQNGCLDRGSQGYCGKAHHDARTTPCPSPSARSLPHSSARSPASTSPSRSPQDEVAAIEAGMDKYAVLVFRDQKLTDEQQMAFTRQLRRHRGRARRQRHQAAGQAPRHRHERRLQPRQGRQAARRATAASACSTSATCCGTPTARSAPIPAKYSLLSARVVNQKGGNTEFADMRAAYDALDDDTKREIEDLVCEHSLMYSRGSLGFLDYTDEEKAMFKPVRQRLVRTHPVTGRKSLYLSSHAGAIIGMPMPEARMLLQRSQRARHPAALRLRAQVDARTTSSCGTTARPCIACAATTRRQPRDMRRTTVAGNAPTVAQAAAE